MVVIDTEVYSNYFLFCALDLDSQRTIKFEMYDGKALNINALMTFMNKYTTISFNGLNFDLYILVAALRGAGTDEVKRLCDMIITSGLPSWQIAKRFDLRIPKSWDHIDLFNVAPGVGSLKMYGARMNAHTIQDLPIEPSEQISADQRKELVKYCINDLKTTELLYLNLQPQLDLRIKMSSEYKLDLRSKSDAQLAEHIIKSGISKKTGKKYYAPEVSDDYAFRYKDPGFIKFENENLKTIFADVLKHEFFLKKSKVQLPDFLGKIKIGDALYKMGLGGLHSGKVPRTIRSNADFYLLDLDVVSYYPNIILQQELAPKNLGVPFLDVYKSIVKRRLKAKSEGDKTTSQSLKIAINGTFGKLGSKYSAIFAPELLTQTTITGQFALLMLIERFENAGVEVVSANTDNVVVKCFDRNLIDAISFKWMLDTTYELECCSFKMLASCSLNNYVAINNDGTLKRKGIFAKRNLMKNPEMSIIYEAVCALISESVPIEETIRNCKDITQFVLIRKVTGGAIWRDQLLGKAVRFYFSAEVDQEECIRYLKNQNKVARSNGAKPLMTIPASFPTDIDYSRYISEANALLEDVGMNNVRVGD